jgi:hypothetical protein
VGLSIVVQDECGTRIDGVDDPTNILHRLLPCAEDLTSRCLRYVDWYGDTVFNRRQVIDVSNELQLLLEKAQTDTEKQLVGRILELAQRVEREPHLYLKFYGD